jgi:hypothetical protein
MPCTVHDVLYRQRQIAQKEDGHALKSDVSFARGISYGKLVAWRESACKALRDAESRLNSHIRDCEVCQAEGLKPIYGRDQLDQ